MPDFVPPGALPADRTDIKPWLLEGLATRADLESRTVGAVRDLDGLTAVEVAVPGADLINGCIGVRQTLEPLITDLHDQLNQLYLDVHAGIASIRQADADNAACLGQVGGR